MHITIYGSGGLGGYFGARLAKAGNDVVFIARGRHLEIMQRNGLRISSIHGDFTLPAVNATDELNQIGETDLIILGVKAWQVSAAARAIKPIVKPGTMILPLQNGVEAVDQIAATAGTGNTLGGLAKIVSYLEAPGHIRHVGADPYIAFGELDNTQSDRMQKLKHTLEQAGITAEIPANIHAAIWNKFLFVASWGGVASVCRLPIGNLLSVPQTRELLREAANEILRLAHARDVQLPADTVDIALAFMETLPAESTTSLQRDIAERKPSELEAWTGAVVRLGRDSNVPAPVNNFIYNCLLPAEMLTRNATL
ncbi:MAG: 2-dehydropantoate 2-reductase [Gammaproteobacteria bacterium]|nr:2-dehydropantoate 2-reductase [Gammaproteobacteria bacterium]